MKAIIKIKAEINEIKNKINKRNKTESWIL